MSSDSRSIFNKTVVILSFVSFLNDISTEFLYPILPSYLRSIGFSVLLIGILEGLAEAVAGLGKGYFGKFSDSLGRRSPFVTIGYSLSAISKPLMAAVLHPAWVFVARTLDRLGKGVRTAARDAMLSESSSPGNKAKVFGFHRGMDTLGAVAGPLLALFYLSRNPGDYRTMFFIAFIPAVVAVMLSLFLNDRTRHSEGRTISLRKYFSFLSYWKESGKAFRILSAGLFAFAIFNSSDMFLLLMVKNLGYGDDEVIIFYIFFNIVVALSAFPAGALADRIGYKKSLLAGLLLFGLAYGLMAFAQSKELIFTAFLIYGLFPSFTDGVSKAWITDITPSDRTATALGFYTGVNSLSVMVSGAVAGAIWITFGANAVFLFSSAGALAVFLFLSAMSGKLSNRPGSSL